MGRGAIPALLRRPSLWFEAVRSWWGMRSSNWRVGVSQPYLEWRLLTAYGDETDAMRGQDLLEFLLWRRGMRRMRKWERV